jgi:CopG family transcriptional regulator/antitoxin EndoAI
MAVRSYVASIGRGNLRKRLTEAARVRSERDQNLVEDWFALDEELWHKKNV